jgi:hypothetical protein
MAIQIIDDFLERDDFIIIKNALMGDEITWFYNDSVSDLNDGECYFTHRFFNQEVGKTPGYHIISPLVEKLKYKKLLRVKGNLYIKTAKSQNHGFHKDMDYNHKGCLLYINTNNGYNYFKEEKKKIKPKENRAVFFDPSIEHRSSTCTDEKRRVTININYL